MPKSSSGSKDLMAHMRYSGCKCNCCMWHRSATVKIIEAVMFIAMIAALTASIIYPAASGWLDAAVLSFVGVVLLIIFIGWLVSMACSCRGRHWIHGADEDPVEVARLRYARGELTKTEYQQLVKEISK